MSAPLSPSTLARVAKLTRLQVRTDWIARQTAFGWSPPAERFLRPRRAPVMRKPTLARGQRTVLLLDQAQLDLPLAWTPRRQLPVLLADGRLAGGPDEARPCTGCPARRICTSLCELVAPIANLPPEEILQPNEISSPALMEGRGYDEPFYVLHPALLEAVPERWGSVVDRFGPKLRRLARGERLPGQPKSLTRQQRNVLTDLLDGRSRTEIRLRRGCSRQAVHKVVHAALRVIGNTLGPLPRFRG